MKTSSRSGLLARSSLRSSMVEAGSRLRPISWRFCWGRALRSTRPSRGEPRKVSVSPLKASRAAKPRARVSVARLMLGDGRLEMGDGRQEIEQRHLRGKFDQHLAVHRTNIAHGGVVILTPAVVWYHKLHADMGGDFHERRSGLVLARFKRCSLSFSSRNCSALGRAAGDGRWEMGDGRSG